MVMPAQKPLMASAAPSAGAALLGALQDKHPIVRLYASKALRVSYAAAAGYLQDAVALPGVTEAQLAAAEALLQ